METPRPDVSGPDRAPAWQVIAWRPTTGGEWQETGSLSCRKARAMVADGLAVLVHRRQEDVTHLLFRELAEPHPGARCVWGALPPCAGAAPAVNTERTLAARRRAFERLRGSSLRGSFAGLPTVPAALTAERRRGWLGAPSLAARSDKRFAFGPG